MKIKTYTKKLKTLTKGYKVTPIDLDPADDLADIEDLSTLEKWANVTPRVKYKDGNQFNRRELMKTMATTGVLPSVLKHVKPKKMESKVYVIQEISGTRHGAPKINIMGASKYGNFVFCLPEMSQIIFSPGPLIFRLRDKLKNYTPNDYLLLTGDPAIIGVACSIVSDITNGKYKLLKWDKQERKYYPIEINLHERGNTDE